MAVDTHLPPLDPYRLIDGWEPGLSFIYQENFLSDEECDHLIAAYERSKHLTFKTAGNVFFDDRCLWINSLPFGEGRAKQIMQEARYRALDLIVAFFQETEPLYHDTVQLVKWHEGQAMSPHRDNCHPDGSPNDTPHRAYSSVVYLNEEYRGGELILTQVRMRVPPRKGLLIGFRADASHEHGVTEVVGGARYTMPAWYTQQIDHQDRWSLVSWNC